MDGATETKLAGPGSVETTSAKVLTTETVGALQPPATRTAQPGAATRSDVPGAAGDPVFRGLLVASGVLVLVLLGAIIVLLFTGGLPALQTFGAGFYASTIWNPVAERFGAGVMIYGTLITGILAVIVAVPMSFGITFFLTELAPNAVRRPIGTAIQLLAAVPSIIYGMWGAFVVVPLLATYLQRPLVALFNHVPGLGVIFHGPAFGSGVLTAGLILALMIIPFITAMMVEIIEAVPTMLKESAYGVGSTTYEVFRNISVPNGRTALVGAVMLGLGRALGETMAVTFVIGNATRISPSLFAPGSTIASTIANQFNEAGFGSLHRASLLQLGFVLFVISFVVLAISRALVRTNVK